MKRRRGNALPETMIVASFMMMMLFGTLNLTLLGYNQVQADGAAFVGARSASLAAQTNPNAALGSAQSQIVGVFPHVQPSAVTVASGGASVISSAASVAMTSPSLPFLHGTSGPLRILSHAAEPTSFSSPPPAGINFTINTSGLKNYADWTTKIMTPTHQAHLSASMRTWCNDPQLPQGAPCDQGVLAVDETCGHDAVYDQLQPSTGNQGNSNPDAFPITGTGGRTPRATALAEINNFSPLNTSSPQYQIAQWDAGNSPSFTGACGTVNWYPSPSGT